MNVDKQNFKQPMEPWPGLEKYQKQVKLDDPDVNLFIYDTGEGPGQTILMVHGLGDEADTWRHVIEPLAEHFRVIAVDLPGFGRSEKIQRDYTPPFFMQTLIALMDALEIGHAILLGNSMGAALSQAMAIQIPSRVKGLILGDGALLQEERMGDWSLRMMQVPLLGEWLYLRLRKDPDAAYDSLRNVYHDLDSLPEEDREFLYKRVNKRVWSDGQRVAYFSTLRNLSSWARNLQEDLRVKLAALEIPTLVVRGEHDSLFPAENAKAVANL